MKMTLMAKHTQPTKICKRYNSTFDQGSLDIMIFSNLKTKLLPLAYGNSLVLRAGKRHDKLGSPETK
jgi:hypothetical protein